MAKINDILNARMVEAPVPESILDVFDTTGGLTEERYQNRVIENLGGTENMPWWIRNSDVTYSEKPVDPTLSYFLGRLKITDDAPKKENGKTAVQKVIDNYKRDWKDWKNTIEKDPNLGRRGWETFKDLWKKAVYDQAEEETKRLRNEAVNDGTVRGFITRTLFPRSTERIASTGDYKPQDMVLDLAENGLMAVPGTGYAKLGSALGYSKLGSKFGISKILDAGNNAVKYLKGSNSPVVTAVGHGIGAVPNTLGNTVVPLVSEVADDVAYDVGEGMDDRANFSAGDVALGGAINQAVNRGLVRSIAPYIDRYSGEVRAMGARKLRNFFEALGKSRSELGKDFATEVRRTINSPVVRTFEEGTRITPGELQSLKNGYNIIPEGTGVEGYLGADLVNRVLGLIDNGEIKMKTGEDIIKEIAKSNKRAAKEITDDAQRAAKQAEEALRSGHIYDAAGLSTERNALENLANGLTDTGKRRNLGGLRPQQIIDGIPHVIDVENSRVMTPKGVEHIFNEHPELYNYAYWKNPTWLDQMGNAINQAVPSWVINKSGKSKYAPEMTKVFEDEIKDNRKQSKEEAKRQSVSKVLEAGVKSGALTETDKKWLEHVRKNPDIVKLGLDSDNASENDAFKMWLLTGGNDLLRGTEAHRPIWEIE